MCIKGSCLLCRNICSAAGRFLQHECLLRVFWAGLYGTMSGYEVLWQLHLLPQVLILLTASIVLTSCFQFNCSSPRFLSQIPQTGLGPTWDGWQRSPIWSPHRRRWERQRHPLWPCKDHGWREWRDHCWEWQAHGARESLRHQPLSSMSLFLHVSFDKCMNPVRMKCGHFWISPLLQTNLVASGGNESEIYIWDLNNFGSPMTPGPKTQVFYWLLSYGNTHILLFWPCQSMPHNGSCVVSCMQMLFLTVVVWPFVWKPVEDISFVSWNRQVQHILASANPSGRASVWDLRKNDLIIKVSDHSNRVCVLSSLRFCFLVSSAIPRLSSGPLSYVCRCVSLDALLWVSLEPWSSNSADFGLRGRPDACHPDVGFTFCYLSSQDFRESHTVDQHQQCCRFAMRIPSSVWSFNT